MYSLIINNCKKKIVIIHLKYFFKSVKLNLYLYSFFPIVDNFDGPLSVRYLKV